MTVPAVAPTSGVDIFFDNRHGSNAAIGGWNDEHVLIELVGAGPHQSGALTVRDRGYEPLSVPSNTAAWQLSGPIDIGSGGRLYIDNNLTVDLRHAGAAGDVLVRSSAADLGLTIQTGTLWADEVTVEGNNERSLDLLNYSQLHARRVTTHFGSDLSMSSNAKMFIAETLEIGGEASIYAAMVTSPQVTVLAGAYLEGTRGPNFGSPPTTKTIVGNLTNSGIVAPGSYVEWNSGYPYYRLGRLVIDGDYSSALSSKLDIDLNGIAPFEVITGDPHFHDVLDVSGNVTLGGALNVAIGPDLTLEPGTAFTFLKVGGLLTGTFAGLAEGSIAYVDSSSGIPLRITYAGGDGNDVALIAVPEPWSAGLVLAAFVVGLSLFSKRRCRLNLAGSTAGGAVLIMGEELVVRDEGKRPSRRDGEWFKKNRGRCPEKFWWRSAMGARKNFLEIGHRLCCGSRFYLRRTIVD